MLHNGYALCPVTGAVNAPTESANVSGGDPEGGVGAARSFLH